MLVSYLGNQLTPGSTKFSDKDQLTRELHFFHTASTVTRDVQKELKLTGEQFNKILNILLQS